MDPRRFDEVARRLALTLSRRSVVGGSLWAALLTALPPGASVLGKNRRQLRQRRQNEREQEKRQREHDRDRRDNKDQNGKNDGAGNDKQEHGRNAKGKRDDGENSNRNQNRNRNRNRNQNRNQNRTGKDKENGARGSNQGVQGEACLNNGKRCGKGKKLKPCSRCCSGFNITTRSKKKKCACRPDGRGCQDNAQCCARVCFGGVCGALS